MQTVYLLIGVPGVGKSWVCERLAGDFDVVNHDDFMGLNYNEALLAAARSAELPVLAEAPFSISQTKDPLERAGVEVVSVFILEDDDVLKERYENREGKEIPKGHLTRQVTYRQRAEEWDAFSGTSEEVLEHLREIAK